jgi:hypothetical protein
MPDRRACAASPGARRRRLSRWRSLAAALALAVSLVGVARPAEAFLDKLTVDLGGGFTLSPAFAIDPYWSKLGPTLGYSSRSGGFMAVAAGGIQYHLWDHEWSWSPKFGGGWGSLGLMMALHERIGLMLSGYIGDEPVFGSSAAAEGTDLSAADAFAYSGQARAGFLLYSDIGRQQHPLLTLGTRVAVQGWELPSPIFASSKSEFGKQLNLVLVESRPIEREEVRELLVDAGLDLTVDWAAASGTWVYGERLSTGFTYSYCDVGANAPRLGIQADTFAGLFPMESLPRDGWLELHVRVTGNFAFSSDAPVYLLPSLGGEYGMLSAKRGTLLNTRAASLALQLGPSFARAYVDFGWTWGVGPSSSVVGGGVAVALPRSIFGEIARHSFLMYWMFSALELNIGGSTEGFILNATLSGFF